MSTLAEKRYVNAKLSHEEMREAVRRWPYDPDVRRRFRVVSEQLQEARRDLRVERNGR